MRCGMILTNIHRLLNMLAFCFTSDEDDDLSEFAFTKVNRRSFTNFHGSSNLSPMVLAVWICAKIE